MSDTLDPKLVDKRTADRYLREGQLDQKAYERHLKSLPDIAEKSEPVTTSMAADEEAPAPTAEETPSI
jgi:hypothetical protein